MKRLLCFISGLSVAMIFAGSGFAQGTDEKCLQNVRDICGDSAANICFATESNWDYTLPECEGDIQTLIELANEAGSEGTAGASLGGNLRSGAGTEFSLIGSLVEGDLVTLEEDAGSPLHGLPWFKVSYTDKTSGALKVGYQWGGVLCSFGDTPGVMKICPAAWAAKSKP